MSTAGLDGSSSSSDPAVGHIDPLRLGQLLVDRRPRASMLQSVRIYRGRPNPDRQAASAAANDRQAAGWERDEQVVVLRRPLRYPSDWPASPATEKGIDVAIAVDLVRLAMEREYDVAILVSADTDLRPALETIYDLRLDHVEVAAWRGANRLRFPATQMPWCHHLSAAEYESLMDLNDYTKR